MTDNERSNSVGPVLRTGEVADAVIEAIQEDNPGRKFVIDDKVSYVRIETEGECIIRKETLSKYMGRPFSITELELDLTSFSGRVETTDNQIRFFLERSL
ncbi:MAG: monooxygenase [Rhodospirillaceae bacterium]|nr:monooxygenase [Alphaproteobacteria bacterium]MBR73080.1 monooxygenase [Rhodospirillaceae bacterium]